MINNYMTVLNYAEYLNDIKNVDDVGEYYIKQSALLVDNVYNLTVILLGMCVNKELSIALSKTTEISVEKFPDSMKIVYDEILRKYIEYNKVVVKNLKIKSSEENHLFWEYIDNMVKILMSGFKYIEKKEDDSWHQCDEHNEWNTRYRREERVRDYMKSLISVDRKYAKFTIKHGIELPYMYTLAWDLPNLVDQYEMRNTPTDENDTSYYGNLPKNISISLGKVSDNMLDILLNGSQINKEKFEDDNPKAPIKFLKKVSYRELLPTIEVVDNIECSNDLNDVSAWAKARKNHILPYIKKEILKKIPLIPMELGKEKHDSRVIKMMVDVFKEENKTKDFLASDIVYLKEVTVSLCEMILDWIWKKDELPLRIECEEAESYLISIIKAANNVPRENTTKNREDHLEKLTTVIAKKWDSKLLTDVNVDENGSDTYIVYAYFSVLKLARNWNEHNLIKNPSITFVVFLFMIAIRYVIRIDNLEVENHREYLYEESKLLKFFKQEKIDYDKEDIEEVLAMEYMKMYQYVKKNAFCNGKVEEWAKKFPANDEVKDPHQVLNTAGYTKSLIKSKMSESEIYLTFWLSIHFGNAKSSFKNVVKSKDLNLMEIVEYTYNYQKQSFLLDE